VVRAFLIEMVLLGELVCPLSVTVAVLVSVPVGLPVTLAVMVKVTLLGLRKHHLFARQNDFRFFSGRFVDYKKFPLVFFS